MSILRKLTLKQHFEMILVNFQILSEIVILDNLGIKFIKVQKIYIYIL